MTAPLFHTVPQQLPSQRGRGANCELQCGLGAGLLPQVSCMLLPPSLGHMGLWSESLGLLTGAWAESW